MTSPATTDETRIAEADDELGLGTGRLDHLDLLQLAFWGCLLIAVAAASVAIAWPDAVGNTGPILLISMAAGGMVFLLWVLKGAGRRLGLSRSAVRPLMRSMPRCRVSAGSNRSTRRS